MSKLVPISCAPINRSSAGRFQRMISFAAVVLLIASMPKSCSDKFKKIYEKLKVALNRSRTVEVRLSSTRFLYLSGSSIDLIIGKISL